MKMQSALVDSMLELAIEDTADVASDEKLLYNRARSFDPTVGRWLSNDPVGFDAGDGNLCLYPRQE